jgi:hypothetical protein
MCDEAGRRVEAGSRSELGEEDGRVRIWRG